MSKAVLKSTSKIDLGSMIRAVGNNFTIHETWNFTALCWLSCLLGFGKSSLARFQSKLSRCIPMNAVANDAVETPPVIKNPQLVSNAGCKPLPAHLPREDVNCDIAETEQKCSGCDQPMKLVGDEPIERL